MTHYTKKIFAAAAAVASLSACAENVKMEQQNAIYADGTAVATNMFAQTNPGMGSKQVCLAGAANIDPKTGKETLIFNNCSTVTGKTAGAVNTVIGAASAGGQVMYGIASVKDAFNPVMQPVSNTTITANSGSNSGNTNTNTSTTSSQANPTANSNSNSNASPTISTSSNSNASANPKIIGSGNSNSTSGANSGSTSTSGSNSSSGSQSNASTIGAVSTGGTANVGQLNVQP